MLRGSVDVARQHCPTKRLTPMGGYWRVKVRGERAILGQRFYHQISERSQNNYQLNSTKLTPAPQALRLDLLAGQALERSDNLATIRRKGQPLRVGHSKSSAYINGCVQENSITKAHTHPTSL